MVFSESVPPVLVILPEKVTRSLICKSPDVTSNPWNFAPAELNPSRFTDTLVIAELTRITNGGTENTDTVFAMFIDLHYQTQQYGTLNRTPNFYA